MSKLSDLLTLDSLKEYLEEQRLNKAFRVQELAIPLFLENKSLHIHAMTGSGKTYSYLLPLIEKIKKIELSEGDVPIGDPRAVIILPTRELATQIYKISKQISHLVKIRVRHLAGGVVKKNASDISKQQIDLLITSPGKYLQLLSSKKLKTNSLQAFVLDEADQLADMGFSKEIGKIKSYISGSQIQNILVSATTPPDFSEFKEAVFNDTKFFNVTADKDHSIGHNIETFNISLKFDEKNKMTKVFLEEEAKGSGIIFLNQSKDCLKLQKYLEEEKVKNKVFVLHGDLSKVERAKALKYFSEKGGILIATDIAARGMDFQKLLWVLNFDLPFEAVYYLHRSGRVGRAGKFGKVYNFITPKDTSLSKKINEAILNQNEFNLSPLKLEGVKKKISKKHTKKKVTGANRSRKKTAIKSGPGRPKRAFTRKKKNHRI